MHVYIYIADCTASHSDIVYSSDTIMRTSDFTLSLTFEWKS